MNPRGANLSYRAFAFMPGYSGTLLTKPKRFPRLTLTRRLPRSDFDVAVGSAEGLDRRGSVRWTYLSAWQIPLLAKEGWTRRQENVAKLPLKERTGMSGANASPIGRSQQEVVAHKPRYSVNDHPVCAITVASRHFSYWRSHPSFARRGIYL